MKVVTFIRAVGGGYASCAAAHPVFWMLLKKVREFWPWTIEDVYWFAHPYFQRHCICLELLLILNADKDFCNSHTKIFVVLLNTEGKYYNFHDSFENSQHFPQKGKIILFLSFVDMKTFYDILTLIHKGTIEQIWRVFCLSQFWFNLLSKCSGKRLEYPPPLPTQAFLSILWSHPC